MKRLLSICLTLSFIFTASALPLWASTTDITGVATSVYQLYLDNDASGEFEVASEVSGFKIGDAEEFIYEALLLANRLLPFSLDYTMEFDPNLDPTTFKVKFNGRNLQDHNREAISKINALVSDASQLPTAIDRINFINNYLVDNCAYCVQAVNDPEKYSNAFTLYGCLVEGSAVCEGYANTVLLFCEKLNIPCVKVFGSAHGAPHVWNSVYLDDSWWMLDVTFNDPVGTQNSTDRYAYFLLDLDTFQAKNTHTFNTYEYELSKKIITGRTEGQYTPVPFYYYNLLNASSKDKLPPLSSLPPTNTAENPSALTTEEKAQWLREHELFFGDENGFRLADELNRIEMGVMMMRLNNAQATVQNNEKYFQERCPFTDVPAWAQATFGYLYSQKLIAGQSSELLGIGQVSLQDYAVILLRILEIEHSYENAIQIAAQHGILPSAQIEGKAFASRGDIVDMTYAALQLQNTLNK